MQNTLTVGFQAAAFIYYSFLVKLNTKTPVVWKKSKRMLANEPDKCILYLYHSHKIAHWQAVFLMAPLEPLTLFEPLWIFGSEQSALLVLGAWWKKQAGGACEHGIPPHSQALKWHRAARLPYGTASHPWWLTARATRPLQVPSP